MMTANIQIRLIAERVVLLVQSPTDYMSAEITKVEAIRIRDSLNRCIRALEFERTVMPDFESLLMTLPAMKPV